MSSDHPVTLRPPTLSGAQRRKLRGLAHHLDAIVQVGKDGLTDTVFAAVDQALEDHELIKVRVLESAPLDRADAAEALAARLGAHVPGQIGRVLVLYRRHPNEPRVPI